MKQIKNLPAGMQALNTPDELREVLAVLNGNQTVTLKREKPQKDYKLVNDVPTHVGWLEMWTIVSDFKDQNGCNRKGSTFGVLGLSELGIDPKNCEVLE